MFLGSLCQRCASLMRWRPRQVLNEIWKYPHLTLQPALTRHYSTTESLELYDLSHRGVIRVAGNDSLPFLQGLVTNDVEILTSSTSLHAFMLNVQGRVLYDILFYNVTVPGSDVCLLLECDQLIVPDFIKLMKRYKIRRKVDLSDVSDEYRVQAVRSSDADNIIIKNLQENKQDAVITVVSKDPRIPSFGWRIITKGSNTDKLFENAGKLKTGTVENYHIERYKTGLSEGITDLPPGNCFPLESNAVFLNAVSFEKGCYIGQELTARTYHTGVTRKRLMPLSFPSSSHECRPGDNVVNHADKASGKVRSVQGAYGLGLLRLAESLSVDKPLKVETSCEEKVTVTTHIPSWWNTDSDQILRTILNQQK